jgi:thymidylate kinase
MVDTNLILIDGLPGSGKSATAQLLWLHLLDNAHRANWFSEHQTSHPIYRYDDAIGKAYRATLKSAPLFRMLVSSVYRHIKSRRIHEEALSNWQRLADSLENSGRITILESTFFQTPIGWLQLMNLEREEILRYVARIQHIIEKLNPVLVYLYQEDPATALRKVREQRGDWFEQLLVSQIEKAPFGRAHRVRNFEGVIRFFLKIRNITDEIYALSGFRKVTLDTSGGSWEQYLDRITDVLSLPRMNHNRPVPADCDGLTGTYRAGVWWRKESIVIAADQRGLYFPEAAGTRLVHKAGNTFCIEGMCVEFSFRSLNGDAEIECSGDSLRLPKLWKRVQTSTEGH